MKVYFALVVLFLSFHFNAFSQSLAEKIGKSFAVFEADRNLKYGIASLTVMNARTGEIIYSKYENLGMAPASTLKAVTLATAYHVLGKDFRYRTDLLYSGVINNGILEGDIIIKGSGDPSLGSDHYRETRADVILKRWTDAIKAAGIKKVVGRIIADDSMFNGQMAPEGWIWTDMGQYYGAGVSALNWRENKMGVIFSAKGRVGNPVSLVKTVSISSDVEIVNEVKIGSAGSGDQVYAYSAPYSKKIILRGTYGSDLNKEVEISLPDGAYEAASSLKLALIKQGIVVDDKVTTAFLLQSEGKDLPANTKLLDRYLSPNLDQLAYWFLKESINLYGEALLKTSAFHEGIATKTSDAAAWEKKFWANQLGIDEGALKIMDGSGLSPENRVSTLSMVKVLNEAKKQSWFASYYENIPLVNNMKMKSGTIDGVLGYVGYHTSKGGTPLIFAFLVNNHEGRASSMRQKMFKVLDSLK
ncbi:D-alanyl-D-alanine carboxypeptidase/D-alanyl-D-alanine endopeptidase [Albibacterium sp.]|uniref:D-alanyl-D-alanine carboxypeptidase/D-alanyl-D-alanine endopeptidase n=1 Tax=Albibacterium sp. TaxID=2952885 RepID=UPI002C03D02B|nr:D-alanyl-D-alanine carboxypeptidase/D-alanyl-D-alanine-endopeptidase [Albibacterium sp.]HUH17736.1 D-alanyl-D-alanine carboxypeptidase/D-alanyl-D-alanine-endopeptidase [Albibacterium sp.]